LIHEAIRQADKRGCCNLPACAFPPRPRDETEPCDTMLCEELIAMVESDRQSRPAGRRGALLAADVELGKDVWEVLRLGMTSEDQKWRVYQVLALIDNHLASGAAKGKET
jgi:hypothetical protein